MTDQVNNQDFVIYDGEYQGTTNIKRLNLLYSIKKNKFIQPFATHGDRVSGDIEYRVFEGSYVLFDLREHRRSELTISLVKLSKDMDIEVCKNVNIYFNTDEFLDHSRIAYDFVRSVPGYHFTRHEKLFKQTYTAEDTQVLLELLNKYDGKEFSEEAEME